MSGRKALLIAHHFTPANSAGVFRTARFVKNLPTFGWSSVVLTATPGALNESEGVVVERIASSAPEVESEDSGSNAGSRSEGSRRVFRPPGFKFAKNLKQLLIETPDQHVLWNRRAVSVGRRLIRDEKPSILYTTGPPHSVHLTGLALKRLSGLPWVADFRDPCARRPWSKRRNPWGNKLLPRFERLIVESADRIVLNTDRATEDFRTTYAGLPADKFVSIPNGCDPEIIERVDGLLADSNANHSAERCPTLLHPGSCYGRRDPRIVVDAIAELVRQGRDIRFRQVGYCAPKFGMLDYACERKVDHLASIDPSVPHDEILQQMAAADFLLLIQPEAPLMVPGKLYEMIAFRKPIVAVTDEGATADLMRKYHLGPVVNSNDTVGLARELATLIDNRSAGERPSEGTQAALEAFDGRALTGQLAAVFDDLVDSKQVTTENQRSLETENLFA